MLFVIVTRIQAHASKRYKGLSEIRPVSDKTLRGRLGLDLTLGIDHGSQATSNARENHGKASGNIYAACRNGVASRLLL